VSAAAVLEAQPDSGRGTTNWMFERWDAEQVAWAQARRERQLPSRIIAVRREPVQADFRALKVDPYSVTEHHGNVITNAGWQALLKAATSGASGPLVFSSTVGRLGVGDTAGTPAAADTDLAASAGATHRLYKLMGAAPTVGTGTNRTWTFVATFGSADFNQAWNEFGIDSGTADGTTVTAPLLNHANSAQGTKTSGQVWTATAVMTFT
jgi:hypothetical protein